MDIEVRKLTQTELERIAAGGQNGFACPKCGKFIPVSSKDLFQKVEVKCPSCSLTLDIDTKKK